MWNLLWDLYLIKESNLKIREEVDNMKYTGYHRTSTKEQHLDRGIQEITRFCKDRNISLHKDKVYTDQQTGKNFDRPSYKMLREDLLESGDTLIITEIDRLGRNKSAILQELNYLKEHNIRVMILELPTTLIDLSTMDNTMAVMMMETINNMMIELYASMAEAEMQKKEKRQREGIQAMKDRGEWDKYGRPRRLELDSFIKEYQKVLQNEIKPFALMEKLNLNKSTYYRYKNEYERIQREITMKNDKVNVDSLIDEEIDF